MSNPGTSPDKQQLQAEIEQTRTELGETVEELAAKTDVKGRAKQTAADLSGRAKQTAAEVGAKAAGVAGTAKDAAKAQAASIEGKVAEVRRDPGQRRRLMVAALVIAAMAVCGLAAVVIRRRRT
jgi:hypothetical protein